jgi:radical SAM protein with 4Fe4S-binding SPASM domain
MIDFIQIDPNGLCNAGCWFCPVSLIGNPKEHIGQMSPELYEDIIRQISELKGDLVNPNLHFVYASHYNEVLLYRHFEEMLKTLKKYNLTLCVLTNGVPLTAKKIDLINKYPGVVSQIAINAPIYEKRLFAKRTGMRESMFDSLMFNIKYAEKNLYNPKILLLQINGINENSNIIKKQNFPDLEPNEFQNQINLAKSIFPNVSITEQWNLIDRAGLMDDVMESKISKGKVIGCSSKRDTNWLHVSPKGHVFLCCNDYHMDYTFGDLNTDKLKDIWMSDKRKKVLKTAFQNICTSCSSAIFENG